MKKTDMYYITAASNGFILEIRDTDYRNDNRMIFNSWADLLTWLTNNEIKQIVDETPVVAETAVNG